MKKVLFAVALFFGAFTASAQESVLKEAKKNLKGKQLLQFMALLKT